MLLRQANRTSPALWGDSRGRTQLRSREKCAVCADRVLTRARRYSLSSSEDSRLARSFVSISSGSDSSIMGTAILYFPVAQLPRSRSRQRALQNGNSAVVSESTGCLQIGHFNFTADSQVWSELSGTRFSLWVFVPARTKPHRLKRVPLKAKSSMLRLLLRAAQGLLPARALLRGAGHPGFPPRGQPGHTRVFR